VTRKLASIQDAVLGKGGAGDPVHEPARGLRLAEFLANDRPLLRAYLGDVKFTKLARAYMIAHPSRTPNARWYARHLPEFLRSSRLFPGHPEIAEIAALESALNDAFDSPEAAVVTMADLARRDMAAIGAVALAISPTVRRLRVTTNVTGIWASLRAGERPPHPINLDGGQELCIWRQGTSARFRLMGDEEAMALDAAMEGVAFGVVCEMIAMREDPDTAAARAAGYLRGWIDSEIIAGLGAAAPDAGNNRDRST
jgi:hypothetical protein